MIASENRLVWIDLEMTGLNCEKDKIIEIALVVTDAQLNIIAEQPSIAIHQPDHTLNAMDAWNKKHHHQSGLVRRVKNSCTHVHSAEQTCLNFLKQHVKEGASPMCGNSICQDRRFLAKYMPQLEAYFHYRQLDVSTLKILCQMHRPEISGQWKKRSTHQALQDIYDSISELKHYMQHFLKCN